MEDEVSVTLIAPAKIDGKRCPAGTVMTVSAALALQLAASGVISPDGAKLAGAFDMAGTPMSADFDKAVEDAVMLRMVDVEKAVEARIRAEVGDEHAAALAEIVRLKALLEKAGKADQPKDAEKFASNKPPAKKTAK